MTLGEYARAPNAGRLLRKASSRLLNKVTRSVSEGIGNVGAGMLPALTLFGVASFGLSQPEA